MAANNKQLFRQHFLKRAEELPQQLVPPLYRHLLLQCTVIDSSDPFLDRWLSLATGTLRPGFERYHDIFAHATMEELLREAIGQFVAACWSDTVEISRQAVDALPSLYLTESDTVRANANLLHEGHFVAQANAFSTQRSLLQFKHRFGSLGCKTTSLFPLPSLPLYSSPNLSPALEPHTAQAQRNVFVSRPILSVSRRTRNRSACSLASWLADALVCGRKKTVGNFGIASAAWSDRIVVRINRKLCQLIAVAAASCPIVIDATSQTMSAGFSADAGPCTVFPAMMCRRRHPNCYALLNWRDCIFGEDSLQERYVKEADSRLICPIQNGIVTDWNGMERMWHHVFYEKLRVAPENHPIIVTESVMNPKANREMLAQIMFEIFNVPALFICSHQIMCMLASHCPTGVLVQSDLCDTSIFPIVDGHVLPHAVSRACCHCGNDLTSHMISLMQRRGVAFETNPAVNETELRWAEFTSRNRVRSLLEALCYVAEDYDLEVQTVDEEVYEPSVLAVPGQAAAICIGSERLACPEILFRPLHPGVASLHGATDAAIKACDASVQHRMRGNVLLQGITFALPGMAARMEKEMRALAPSAHVSVSLATAHSAWIAGARVASSSSFLDQCMSYGLYCDCGPTAVHSKFPAFAAPM
jgi:actin